MPGSLAALSQTKVLSGPWVIDSETASSVAVKMTVMPGSQSHCQGLSESFVPEKCVPMFLKENIILYIQLMENPFLKIWCICLYLGSKKRENNSKPPL